MSTSSPASSTAAQLQSLGDVQLYGPDGKKLDLSQEDRIGFSPGMPQAPVITQRGYPPWEWERPVGWNLMWTPRGESTTKGTTKSFAELRALAQWCTEARIAIEIQKKKIRGLAWSFVPLEDSWSKSAREKYRKQVDAAKTWWRRPNKIDDVNFSAWLGQVVEEMYVTDACVLYKQRTFGGALDSLVQLDGATIKIDIDNFGHVLQYRQMIYGRPVTAYAPSDLAYVVFNPRVDQVYGTSPLEEIAPVIQTAVKRQLSHLSYYTEGNVPMATLGVPSDWPVKRIREIQTYLDETFSGDDRLRHKVRAIPMTPGNRSGGVLQQLRPFEFNQAEHEALMTLIAVHFGVSPAQFRSQTGIGGGSLAKEQNDEASDVGQAPLRKHLAEFITEVTQNELGLDSIKFVWDDTRASTDTARAQSLAVQIQAGILTVNEARAELGMEPLAENQAVAVPAAAVKEEAKPEVPGAEVAAAAEEEEEAEPVAKANPYREPSGGRFASNDYPGGPVATARLAALPDEPRVPIGLLVAPEDALDAMHAAVEQAGHNEMQTRALMTEPENVPLADLHQTQDTVTREKLARFINDPVEQPVTVVRHGGRLFVHDGHHRLAAARLRGIKTVPAKVVDLGDIKKEQDRDEYGRFAAIATAAHEAAQQASASANKASRDLGDKKKAADAKEHEQAAGRREMSAKYHADKGDRETAAKHAAAAEGHRRAASALRAAEKARHEVPTTGDMGRIGGTWTYGGQLAAGREIGGAAGAAWRGSEAERRRKKSDEPDGLQKSATLDEIASVRVTTADDHRDAFEHHEAEAERAREVGDTTLHDLHASAAQLHYNVWQDFTSLGPEPREEARAASAAVKDFLLGETDTEEPSAVDAERSREERTREDEVEAYGEIEDRLTRKVYRGLAGVPEAALRRAIGKSLPAGDLTASPDRAEVERLLGPDDALVEFSGEGDHIVILGVDREGDRLVVRGRVE